MKTNIIFLILSVIIIMSCADKSSEDIPIVAFCLSETADWNTNISCAEIDDIYINSDSTETTSYTLFAKTSDYNYINKVLTAARQTGGFFSPEVRIYINTGDEVFYITDNDVVLDKAGKQLNVNDKDVYHIKSILRYYNTMALEELKENSLIRKYGIPKEYQERKILPKNLMEPKKVYTKIILYKRN